MGRFFQMKGYSFEKGIRMNYNQNRSDGSSGGRKMDEAELFAEILSRLDEKQKSAQAETARKPAQQREGMEIDLVELFYYIISKLRIILLGMVIGAVLLGFYAVFIVTPVYTATSKLYIIGNAGNSILSDLQIGTALTMDYQEVFNTWEVHQMVNEELGTDYDYSTLQGMVSVSNPDDTHILSITVRNSDSKKAADIANAYATAAKRFIVQTMNTDEPSTFSIALVPGVASGTGVTGYVVRGILLGTVLAGGILVLIFLLDNRPKSPEDIMHYAGIPTLAVIPDNPLTSGEGYKHSSGSKTGRRRADKS